MGLLERWDRRNQRVLEEHNRRYKAEQAAGGGSGALGGVLFGWGIGRAIGKGLWSIDPWYAGMGVVLLAIGAALWLHGRRSRSGPDPTV